MRFCMVRYTYVSCKGMRIPVSVIMGQIAHGATVEEVLADYPDLERADVQQALE